MSLRANLLYGLGLLVLVPAVLAATVLPWREKYVAFSGEGATEVAAARGQAARHAGVEWRLVEVEESPPKDPSRPLPPRTKIAVMLISARPLTEAASKWFGQKTGSCKFLATDAAGRVWSPATRSDLVERSDYAMTCRAFDADYNMVPLPVGRTLTIQVVYVVPADAFPTLSSQIRLSPDPVTIRLAR
ncbi:hypothetical protein GCM10009677_06590 [Sphaerisporangium rubeum]|uniref:DUF4352 domain-containing protein n=1 Tax=Sphaerisporangium rubeum TaxID=321317 RepID=A0A7X0IMS8_9ACTN|nr:hypothetical protein [Sphaerisporangium rubeum]MBB6476908.1 hypothetical protein [Sphaerisporangium rubeum]